MPLLETCNELFGSSDLYSVLGVEKTASQGQIKKAYHKVSDDWNVNSSTKMVLCSKNEPQGSLKVHPDRVAEDEREICTKKFQVGKFFLLWVVQKYLWWVVQNDLGRVVQNDVWWVVQNDLWWVVQNDWVICTCCNYSSSQCLSAVYTVLSDESRRGLYDESGEVCITK